MEGGEQSEFPGRCELHYDAVSPRLWLGIIALRGDRHEAGQVMVSDGGSIDTLRNTIILWCNNMVRSMKLSYLAFLFVLLPVPNQH